MDQNEMNPFVGPRPFERRKEDSARFFGRMHETEEITSLIYGHRVTLVYAQSGAGKTSLFNASVAPELEENGFEALPLTRVGGVVPDGIDVKDIKNLYMFNALLNIAPEIAPKSLVSNSLVEYMESRVRMTDENGQLLPRAIIFDQFEELFTYTPEDWREQRKGFFRQIIEALDADSLLRIVFVMREDFLAEMDPYARDLPDRLRIRYRLERLGEYAALRAIKMPLANTSRSFAPGVAEKLVNNLLATRSVDVTGKMTDIEGQYVEPVQLQVVCATLWSALESDVTEIQYSHLSNFDVTDALSVFYNTTVNAAAKSTGVSEANLRHWFGNTIITAMGTRSTVFRGEERTGGIDNKAVDFLENQHIIRAEFRAGARWYELTHDRLIDPIRESNVEWFEKNLKVFQRQTTLWTQQGRSEGLLFRGAELRKARRDSESLALTTDEKQFLDLSKKSESRRYFTWGIVIIVITFLTGISFFAFTQRNLANENARDAEENLVFAMQNEEEANKQRELAQENEKLAQENAQAALLAKQDAENQKLIAQAQRTAARAQIYQTQPGGLYTSTLLAISSWKTSPSIEAEEILRKNVSLLPVPVSQKHLDGSINSLEFNPAGDMFVTGSANGETCVWKTLDGEMVFCKSSPKSVNDVVFSPNGEYLVTGDSSGEVQIIRTMDWTVQKAYNAGVPVWDIDISEAGQSIAVTRDDGRIAIVNLATGEEEYPLFATGKIRIASFSPNGYYIATGSSNGIVTVWSLGTGEIPISRWQHIGEVLTLEFNPDSRYLVTGGADGNVVVANISSGQELYRLFLGGEVTEISFNPDGSWFATSSDDRIIRLWETNNGSELLRILQYSEVQSIKVSSSGQRIATINADRALHVWNTSTGTEIFQIPVNGDAVIGFSADDNKIAIGDSNGGIDIWDISDFYKSQNLLSFDDQVGDMQFSPLGNIFAVSDGPRIWLLNPDELSTLRKNELGRPDINVTGNVTSLIFSPDSNWLGISTDAGYVLVYHLVNHILRTFSASGTTRDISFSPDNTQLLVSQTGGSVDAWNLVTQEQTVSFAGGLENVTSLTSSSSQIAIGVEDEIVILNENGEIISSIESPGDRSVLTYSPDGSKLASSNSEGLVEVWQLEDGIYNLIGSIRKETVYSLAFNLDGSQLAVGTTDTVYLINTTTVNELSRIPHGGKVVGVSYSEDGNMLATASNKIVQFWDIALLQELKTDFLVDSACSRLVANFSQSQWNNLFGREEYQVLCENLPVP